MKFTPIYIVLCGSIGFTSCFGQSAHCTGVDSDWAMRIDSPSKDSLDQLCSVDIKDIVRIQKDSLNPCDLYYYQGQLLTGWGCEIIPNHPHKFRFEGFEKGRMIWRVSYYDNGQIDGDFRMKDCKNYGPSRMWLYNGDLYIDEFYAAPGIKHGVQRQWHSNGVLARESLYDNGTQIQQKTYDRNGILIATH